MIFARGCNFQRQIYGYVALTRVGFSPPKIQYKLQILNFFGPEQALIFKVLLQKEIRFW